MTNEELRFADSELKVPEGLGLGMEISPQKLREARHVLEWGGVDPVVVIDRSGGEVR